MSSLAGMEKVAMSRFEADEYINDRYAAMEQRLQVRMLLSATPVYPDRRGAKAAANGCSRPCLHVPAAGTATGYATCIGSVLFAVPECSSRTQIQHQFGGLLQQQDGVACFVVLRPKPLP
jgi:hypothetical protein